MDAWWRCANYLAVGQTYLMDNPLLKEPLTAELIKPTLLGHWGSAPGLNFIYVHLNRVITTFELDMIYIAGPGHCGHAMIAGAYLDGTYSEVYPSVSLDKEGWRACSDSSPSPRGAEPRGARDPRLHPRGRRAGLQPAARHRRGPRQSRPGGGGDRQRRGVRDGAPGRQPALEQVPQPGQRRGGTTDPPPQRVQDRPPDRPGPARARGAHQPAPRRRMGPVVVEGHDPALVHQPMAAALDGAVADIRAIQARGRSGRPNVRQRWPMVVLAPPRGGRRPRRSTACPRRDLALPPHPARAPPQRPRPARPAPGLVPQLPTRGAVRRERCAPSRDPAARPRARPG